MGLWKRLQPLILKYSLSYIRIKFGLKCFLHNLYSYFPQYLTVAKVFIGDTNILQEMIKRGFIIQFEKYSNSTILANLQESAKKQKLGIGSSQDIIKKQYIFQKKLTDKK